MQLHKILYFVLILFLYSCNSTKNLKKNEYLLKNNEVNIQENKEFPIDRIEEKRLREELLPIAVQKPNKSFLFLFHPRLSLYNLTVRPKKEARRESKGKNPRSKLNIWIRDKIGEPPIIFDSTLLSSTEDKMKNYLINQGYLNAKVKSQFKLHKKKAETEFDAFPGKRFYFKNYYFEIDDPNIDSVVQANMQGTYIKNGVPYTTDALRLEQERITNVLNDNGFFSFIKNNIVFEVDTSGEDLMKDVYIQIKKDVDDLARKQYKVGFVNFNINYSNMPYRKSGFLTDTLRNLQIYYSPLDIKPDIIAESIFYMPDSTFRKSDYKNTISRLTELGIFRFVNIKYKPLLISQTEGYVDTEIEAQLRKRQSGKIELEANTDAKDRIGTFFNISYINKNIFKRADRLQFNISNGVEFRFSNLEHEGERNSRLSSLNLLLNTRLYFPKLFPQLKKVRKANNYMPYKYPKNTFFNLGYNFQRRIGFYSYSINTFNIGYGYDIKGKFTSHEIQPFSLSFIKPRAASFNSNFIDFLTQNPIFAQAYRQQFIMGQEYTFTYNNQDIKVGKIKSIFFYRGIINTAGNIVYGLQSLVKKKPEGGYTLSGIPYASYTKIDNDFRYYFTFKNTNTLAARFFAGVGIPYGNSKIMPFIKQYAAGGPQSMRGWNYRELGPGSADTSVTSLDLNTGDIQLEFNLEYRFSLSKLFKMALFTDVGNIWLMRADSTKPNAEFKFKRLGQDLAWSAGFGFRLDFGLFVIRFDNSYRIYDPNITKDHRWINQYPGYYALNEGGRGRWNDKWKSWRSRYANFVIGIGYPF